MEHLVQTVENEVLIHKCLRKCWTLEQFLEEAKEFESTNLQVSEIEKTQKHSVAKVYKKNTEGGDTGHEKQADGQDVSTVGCLEYIPKGKIVLLITRDALNAAKWTTLSLCVGQDNTESPSLINFVDLK